MHVLLHYIKMRLNITMSKYRVDQPAHKIILDMVKPNSLILEFGPSYGLMTRVLKEDLHCSIYAVEIDHDAACETGNYCEKIVVDSIETYTWKQEFANIKFDFIIFADVLEHLYDPWKVLSEVKAFLKSDGKILISLPNIAHNAIIMNLIEDVFEYNPTGLLDNTHIRFFTKNSIDNMVKKCGYKLSLINATYNLPESTEFKQSYAKFSDEVCRTLLHKKYGHVYQFIYEIVHAESEIASPVIENIIDTVENYKFDSTSLDLQEQLANKTKELDDVYNSKSWKLTSPLRKMFRFIKW